MALDSSGRRYRRALQALDARADGGVLPRAHRDGRAQHSNRSRSLHRVARPGARLQTRPDGDPRAARPGQQALGAKYDIAPSTMKCSMPARYHSTCCIRASPSGSPARRHPLPPPPPPSLFTPHLLPSLFLPNRHLLPLAAATEHSNYAPIAFSSALAIVLTCRPWLLRTPLPPSRGPVLRAGIAHDDAAVAVEFAFRRADGFHHRGEVGPSAASRGP